MLARLLVFVALSGLLGAFLSPSVSAATVHLGWEYVDNADPAVSFSIYRDTGCLGGYLFRASVPRSQLDYIDGTNPADTLQAGATYCYQVTAIGADGRESVPSNTLIFLVPLQTPPPNPPGNLHAL